MKRNAAILISLLVISVAAYFYFSPRKFSFSEISPAYHAIPFDAPVFFEFRTARLLNSPNSVWDDMNKAGLWLGLFRNYQKIDSLIVASDEIPNRIRNERIIVALKNEGRDEMTPLFLAEASGSRREIGLKALFTNLYPAGNYNIRQRSYDKFIINDITDEQNRTRFSFAFAEGIMLASTKSAVIEQALRQLQSPGLVKDPGFKELGGKFSANSGIIVYINHKFFPGFISNWLNGQVKRRINEFGETETIRYSAIVSLFREYAAWSGLDINIKNSDIQLKGISVAYDSLNQYLTAFSGQQPLRSQADRFLPGNTKFYVSYSISDPQDFFGRLESFFSTHHKFYSREEKFNRMATETRTNVKRLFSQLFDNEIITANTDGAGDTNPGSGLLIIPVRNLSEAELQIRQMLGNYASRRNQNLNDMVVETTSISNRIIYQYPYPSMPGLWLGYPFRSVKANFVSFGHDAMVFASSVDELDNYFFRMDKNETLSKDPAYKKFMQNSEKRSNIQIFMAVNQNDGFLREALNPSVVKTISQKRDLTGNFTYINWQVIHSKDGFINSFMMGYNRE